MPSTLTILPIAMTLAAAFQNAGAGGPMTRHSENLPCAVTADPVSPSDSLMLSVRLPDRPFSGLTYATIFTEVERESRGTESGPTRALTREEWRPGQMVSVGRSPRMGAREPLCLAELVWTTRGPTAWNGHVPREAPTRLAPGVAPSAAPRLPDAVRHDRSSTPRQTAPSGALSRPR